MSTVISMSGIVSAHTARVGGMKLDEAIMTYIRKKYGLVVGDAENLPFRDDAFDYVFVHDGLHHLPDAYRGVREMLRVARHEPQRQVRVNHREVAVRVAVGAHPIGRCHLGRAEAASGVTTLSRRPERYGGHGGGNNLEGGLAVGSSRRAPF